MQTAVSLAEELYRQRRSLSDQVVANLLQIWQTQVDPNNLDASWDSLSQVFAMQTYNAQIASATLSVPFVDAQAALQGVTEEAPLTDPRQYAGVAPDGRGLTPLLYGSVTATKTATAQGQFITDAFKVGAAFLSVAVSTAITDSGRYRDGTYALGRGARHYVRAISPGACSRCAILAGSASSASAFPRHPNCHCYAVPVWKQTPAGFFDSAQDYFESLDRLAQDRIFTRSGAQAIRDGADMNQVVNSRRGAITRGAVGETQTKIATLKPVLIGYGPDGQAIRVFKTAEGNTYHGRFGRREYKLTNADPRRRSTTLRLMPEQIYKMAGTDPDRAVELLKRYGYIF